VRLARCCQIFPVLWRGEEVSDPELELEAASLGPLAIVPPPIFVGGTSAETMAIAAEHADGWNAVVADATVFAELAAQAEELGRRLGREQPLRKAAQVFSRDIQLSNARRLVAELEEAEAEGVTFVLVEERGPEAVRALAQAVL
jgi:alkanesulfonate monooxygenase SsuD/methylene tetrahydromethanopterin reductase-like flavin-dependent oxidoreductase (luciferase family)